jgi:two-component system, response regulator
MSTRSSSRFKRLGTDERFIVIIDDNPDELLLLRRSLLKGGVTSAIYAFERPTEAIAFIHNTHALEQGRSAPNTVIFCDLKMPGFDGFDVLRSIRSKEYAARIRFIIVSGCAFEADVEQARSLGADGYLEKMPSTEALLSCLATPTFAPTGSRPELFRSWEAAHGCRR